MSCRHLKMVEDRSYNAVRGGEKRILQETANRYGVVAAVEEPSIIELIEAARGHDAQQSRCPAAALRGFSRQVVVVVRAHDSEDTWDTP